MKWGKKKKPSSASTSSNNNLSNFDLISYVLPRSWLSKFKQTTEKPVLKTNLNEMKRPNLEKWSPRGVSPSRQSSYYYKDEDGFWRLRIDEENTGLGAKFAVTKPSCVNCKTNAKQVATTTTMTMKKKEKKVPREKDSSAKEEVLQRTYKRIVAATKELHRELDEVYEERKPEEWRDLKDTKIREIMSKNNNCNQQRKSVHVSREMSNANNNVVKGRVRSPRTPIRTEACKIRALEDMKRAKLMKTKAKEAEQVTAFGSFAVVKRSCDPQQDFKESMLEMILEKRIKRPDELEELLACYLTLNSEEYHDVIVKVFRQVWCELEQGYCN